MTERVEKLQEILNFYIILIVQFGLIFFKNLIFFLNFGEKMHSHHNFYRVDFRNFAPFRHNSRKTVPLRRKKLTFNTSRK